MCPRNSAAPGAPERTMASLLTGPVTSASASPLAARSHAASTHASCAAPEARVGAPGFRSRAARSRPGCQTPMAPRASPHASAGSGTRTIRFAARPRPRAAAWIAAASPTSSTRARSLRGGGDDAYLRSHAAGAPDAHGDPRLRHPTHHARFIETWRDRSAREACSRRPRSVSSGRASPSLARSRRTWMSTVRAPPS